MAMNLNDNVDETGGGELHDINVTPFIDVMLVLLIIFMVAAPLATVDVKIDLPSSSAKPQPRPEKPVYVSVKADKQIYVGNNEVSAEELVSALERRTKGNKETVIFFQADKTVDYQTVMTIMDTLRGADYLKIGLMGTESGHRGRR